MPANTTSAAAPPGAIYEVAAAFSADLEALHTHASDQMVAAWAQTYAKVREDYAALLDKMAAAKAAGQPVKPAWLYQQTRLKSALATTKSEVAKYAETASAITLSAHQSAVLAAQKHAAKLGQVAMTGAGLSGDFTTLNPANLSHLVGFLQDGSPVADLFAGLADETAAAAVHALTVGVTLGKGPDWMARRLSDALDLPRWRATTIMRTETQRVYRSVARQTYLANDDLLEGWVWTAHLDSRACPACVAMDGTIHPVTATLDGHPRCRCAMVPRTKSWADLGVNNAADTRPPVRSGIEWLKAAPASVQRAVLGPAKYRRFAKGDLDLNDLVARTEHPAWGTMRRERSLREIDEGLNANYADAVQPTAPAPRMANPRAADKIAKANTLEEVQAALAGEGLTAQQVVDYKAAEVIHLNRLEYTVRLPGPDVTKAQAIADKLDQAALTKGYPSKGYSQTQAIYKAQANGTVGTQVGVVKSLTWEQKVTAQKALALHGESLPKIIREAEKSDALKAEAAKAQADHAQWLTKGAKLPEGTRHEAYMTWVESDAVLTQTKAKALLDAALADPSLGNPMKSHAYAKITARRTALQAERQAYEDARQAMLDRRHDQGDAWYQPDNPGAVVKISEDGWGTYHEGDALDVLNPHQVQALLDDPEWQPMPPPADPTMVAGLVKALTTKDGYLDTGIVQTYETLAAKGTLAPQQQANMVEALAQAKASLLPMPEPLYVAKIVDDLKAGTITMDQVDEAVENFPPQAKSNMLAGKAKYQQFLDDQAKVSAAAVPDEALVEFVPETPAAGLKVGDLVHKGNGKTTWQVQAVNDDGMVMVSKPGTAKKGQGTWQHPDQFKPAATPPAVPANATPPVTFGAPPDPADLTFTGKVLGTHGAKVYEHADGSRWLFKPPKDAKDGFLTTLDAVAARLTARTGLKAPDTFVMHLDGRAGSIQRMFDAQPAFPGGFKPAALSDADLLAVQRQHVMDWLLSNHDGHLEQFLRMPDGTLVGIDQGQAFRWMGQDRLDWDFHPNGYYGAPEPVYNALYREFAKGGGKEVLDPRHGPLADYIKSVQGISDDDLRAMLRPYAEEAAARGKLALPQPGFPGVTAAKIAANDVDAFLDAVVARKNALADDFSALYEKAVKARQKALPEWVPTKPTPSATKKAQGRLAAWEGAPEPVKPPAPPQPPSEQQAALFDGWLAKAEARYADNPNKAKNSLAETANWGRFQRVIQEHDRSAVQELLDRQYLTQEMADEALAIIDKAERAKAAVEAAYKAALADHERAMKAYARDLADWREANGIKITTRGMDEAVKRHDTNAAGTRWADSKFKADRWTTAQRQALQEYTGSSYSTWNDHLRRSGGDPGPYKATLDKIDAAMDVQPIPEDVILHRGTGVNSFTVNGSPLGVSDAHRLTELVGTVQRDHAYMSTSVGAEAAFNSYAVQIKLRAPAGTRGAYVKAFSHFSRERELILARGTSYYVHAVYKAGHQWVVEAEIVEDGFTPPLGADGAPVVSPSARKWSANA